MMYYACRRGDYPIINYLLSRGIDTYDGGLKGAAESGNQGILDWMISLGATDFTTAINYAALGGHLSLLLKPQ